MTPRVPSPMPLREISAYSGHRTALPLPQRDPQPRPQPSEQRGHQSVSAVVLAFWVPIAALAFRLISSLTGNAAYVLVAFWALLGPRQAVVALYLCWFFNVLNHGLVPVAGMASMLRHAITACAFLSVMFHSAFRTRRNTGLLLPLTFLLCGFLIVHSMLFSEQVDVSVMKSISFTMTVTGLALGWASMSDRDREITERFIFGSLGLIAIASIPLVATPIGYFRNGQGFQGIQVHPQGFGPTMGAFGALLIAQAFTDRKLRVWKAALLALALVWVYLSKARIGALALVAGVVLGIGSEIVRSWLAAHPARNPLRRSRLAAATVVAVVVGLAIAPLVADQVMEFITKGSAAESVYEAAIKSRGGKIDEMMRNIERSPLLGTGFGVLSGADYFALVRDPIFGLPVMATVEKGVLPIAIVEETGVVGALFTYPWLIMLVIRAIRGGVVPGTVCWSVLITNLAEASLFAPGGQGMLQLMLALWAATAPPVAAPIAVPQRRALPAAA